MALITIHMSGDDARVRAMHERLLSDQQKLLDKYAKLGQQSKKLSDDEIAALKKKADEERAFQKLQERATKIIKDTATAHEAYSQQVKEANEMRQKGLLTQDQYNRKLAQLKQELRDVSGATARLKAAEVEEERAVQKATATTQRYMTTLEKLEAELADVRRQHEAGRVSIETVERAQKKLNDAQAEMKKGGFTKLTEGIEGYVTGLASVSTAVMAIRAAWQQVNQEQQKGLEALKGTSSSDSKLIQVSTAEEYKKRTAEADRLSVETGVDRSVVRDVMFSGISEGFESAVPDLVRAAQVFPEGPQEASGVAGQVPALFKGSIAPMEAVSMTLKAAELSRLDFGPLAKSLPQAAEGGSIAKASPEETMATLSVLASRFKSGDTAADRIKAFATKVGIDKGSVDDEFDKKLKTEQTRATNAAKSLRTKEERVKDLEEKIANGRLSRTGKADAEKQLARAKRDVEEFDRSTLDVVEPKRSKPTRDSLQGKGIIKAVEALQAMTPEQRSEFLGDSQELNTAYVALTEELDKIKSQAEILGKDRTDFAAGGGSLREKVAIADADPRKRALKGEAIAQRLLEVTQDTEKGIEGAAASGGKAQAEASLLRNDNLVTRTIGNTTTPVVSGIGAAIGMDQVSSGAAAAGFARGLSGAVSGTAPLSAVNNSAILQSEATAKAAEDMKAAAADMKQAAATIARPQSISNAARAQAARAGQ